MQPQKNGSIIETPVLWKDTDCFQLQQGNFLDAIRTSRKPINSAEQALMLMKILDAVYKSSATGKEVRL